MTAYQPSPQPTASAYVPPPAAATRTPSGLTVPGVVVIVGLPTVLAALAETAWHSRLSWVFGLVFAASSLLGALQVRRSTIAAGAVVPPLVFLAALLVAHPLLDGGESGVKGLLLDTGTALTTGAPYLVPTAIACAVVVLVRRRG